jgi:hypothetical protein
MMGRVIFISVLLLLTGYLKSTMADARAIVMAAYYGDLEEVGRLVQQDRGLLDAGYGESLHRSLRLRERVASRCCGTCWRRGPRSSCGIPAPGPPLSGHAIARGVRQCMCT